MPKTSNIFVRVEQEVKKEAEEILNSLGLNTSTAINMFLKQIILKKGVPFDVNVKEKISITSKLTKDELIEEIKKGEKDLKVNKIINAEDVFSILKEKYGL